MQIINMSEQEIFSNIKIIEQIIIYNIGKCNFRFIINESQKLFDVHVIDDTKETSEISETDWIPLGICYTKCNGCNENYFQPNQLAHMDLGGCLSTENTEWNDIYIEQIAKILQTSNSAIKTFLSEHQI